MAEKELQRVQKIMANAGLMSRRKAEDHIAQGRVKVNGKIITLGDQATLDDNITVDGKRVEHIRKRYIIFHKPPHCLTTLDDPQGRMTIFKYIKEKDRLIPVGRLDYKSEGLLLLTNDGDFANKVMHPRYETKKNYIVYLHKPLSEQHKHTMEKGVELEDGWTRPINIFYLGKDKKIVEVKIHEGKKRIVRRIFYKYGYKTQRLIRTRVGKLDLGDLQKGKYRNLTPAEVKLVFK